jgi:hypothetical protein
MSPILFLIYYSSVICKVTLCLRACFYPLSPLLVVSAKVKKFLLNLSMKCWNSAFNAQGLRVLIVVVQGGKRKDRMKLNLPPKLLEKLVWVPIIPFCKICRTQKFRVFHTHKPKLCVSLISYNSMNFSQNPNLCKSLISYIISWISHKTQTCVRAQSLIIPWIPHKTQTCARV